MMMKAISFVKTKPKVIETEQPIPKENELLVKVAYSALDTVLDPVIEKTFVGSLLHKLTDPLFCGWHYSGVVEAVGTNVKNISVGNEVFGNLQYSGETTQGSLSEYIVVKADACALKPKSVPANLAAVATTEPVTAIQCLRDEGGLKAKQSVLINGAGGTVGALAVQIAKRMGAHVTAICSTKDVKRVTNLGADVVVDRKKTPTVFDQFEKGQFHVIFDTPGKLSAAKSLKHLKAKGVYVNPSPDLLDLYWGKFCALFTSKSVKMMIVVSKKADLELVGGWLEDGLVVDIDSEYSVNNIEQAMERNRKSETQGRVVVKVQGGW